MNRRRVQVQSSIVTGYKQLMEHDFDQFIRIIQQATIHDLEQLRVALNYEVQLSLECIADGEEVDDRDVVPT